MTHPFQKYAKILYSIACKPPPPLPGTPWSDAEVLLLKHLFRQQATTREILRSFPTRTEASIKRKAHVLGIYRGTSTVPKYNRTNERGTLHLPTS